MRCPVEDCGYDDSPEQIIIHLQLVHHQGEVKAEFLVNAEKGKYWEIWRNKK